MEPREARHVKRMILPALLIGLGIALLPAAYAGSRGGPSGQAPDVVVLDRLADAYEPVTLNHKGHAQTAGGCTDCHHQHGQGQALSCGDCHAVQPEAFKKSALPGKLKGCRNCHPPAIRPAAPEVPTLQAAYHRACFKCHREMGSVGKDPQGCTDTCHAKKGL
jgi:hypothetical protein